MKGFTTFLRYRNPKQSPALLLSEPPCPCMTRPSGRRPREASCTNRGSIFEGLAWLSGFWGSESCRVRSSTLLNHQNLLVCRAPISSLVNKKMCSKNLQKSRLWQFMVRFRVCEKALTTFQISLFLPDLPNSMKPSTVTVWFLVGNGGMDPYSSPYIIPNYSPKNPSPQSLLSTRELISILSLCGSVPGPQLSGSR